MDKKKKAVIRKRRETAKKYRSYADAKKFVSQLGIKNMEEWKNFTNSGTKPVDIPNNPEKYYSDWSGFGGFSWSQTGSTSF